MKEEEEAISFPTSNQFTPRNITFFINCENGKNWIVHSFGFFFPIFMEFYGAIHTPLVLVLCVSGELFNLGFHQIFSDILGTIGHILSIGVLLKMLNPTNLLLMSMSV